MSITFNPHIRNNISQDIKEEIIESQIKAYFKTEKGFEELLDLIAQHPDAEYREKKYDKIASNLYYHRQNLELRVMAQKGIVLPDHILKSL